MEAALDVDHLSIRFGQTMVLHDISFRVERGASLGLGAGRPVHRSSTPSGGYGRAPNSESLDAERTVAGYVRVGNRASWLGRCQALVYLCGSHLDRRAYDYWNCITVVPGEVSAFRRAAVDAVGGILGDTLAEDTDPTLRLHRAGWRVRFAPDAIGDTEAPETVRALMRQRVRWAFGTLQCLWKHRDMIGNPRYRALGLFSLPGVAFCHFFLVATIPLVDGALLCSRSP